MVIRVEKQRELHYEALVEVANVAGQGNMNSNPQDAKDFKKCSYCRKSKRTREECWKLNGPLNWIKQKEQKNGKGKRGKKRHQSHLDGKSTPFDSDDDSDNEFNMMQII